MVARRCCCCPKPGPTSSNYTIMKLNPDDGSRVWHNDCIFVSNTKPSDFLITGSSILGTVKVLHSGFNSGVPTPKSLRYAALFLDGETGIISKQPEINGNFGTGGFYSIIEAENYFWLANHGGNKSIVIDKSDYSADLVSVGTTSIRRNLNVATWGDYLVGGYGFGTTYTGLTVYDTDGSTVKWITLSDFSSEPHRMYAFCQANTDGKVVIFYRDHDDDPDTHKVGIFDLDSETFDDELELTYPVVRVDTTETAYDFNGDYVAIVGSATENVSTDPEHSVTVEVFNLNNLAAAHWSTSYHHSTGFSEGAWVLGPMRVSSDGSEVACPASNYPQDSIAVLNSTGLKWRKTLTGYSFNNGSNGAMDVEFDGSGNVYTNGNNASFEHMVVRLASTDGSVDWERKFAHPSDPIEPDLRGVSRITAHGDGIFVCGERTGTNPYSI